VNSKIIKNAFWLFSGQAVGRILRAILIVVAARVLGVTDWGVFAYAMSLIATFTVLSDIGINALLVRENNRNSKFIRNYLATGLVVKLSLIFALSVFIVLFQDVIVRVPEAAVFIPLIIIIFTLDSLRNFVSALARSLERMDIEAKGQIVTNASIVGFGLLFLSIYPTSSALVLSYVVGTFIGLMAIFIPLKSYFKGLMHEFNRKLVREIIVSAWPFGMVSLMGIIMINTDILVLGAMTSATEVGLYAAAQKPIQLLYLIPSLLVAAFFPTLSREAGEKKQFRDTLEKGLKSVYLFAIPLSIGGALAARSVIGFLYGPEFLLSYLSFALLSLTFLFVFPSSFFTSALFAQNNQKSFYGYLVIGVLMNIILNIILIPHMGIAGCALATLIVQILLFIYGITMLKKSLSFRVFPNVGRIIVSALVMALVVAFLLFIQAHALIVVGAGFLSYLLMLIVLREPTLAQIIFAIRQKPGITSGVEI